MSNLFTVQFQVWSTLAATAIFACAAYFTRATRWRRGRAILAALVCSVLNIVWDLVASRAGWWIYPRRAGAVLPIPVYFAQDLVWCGALGLVGWRIYRRFNLVGAIAFVVLFGAVGCMRDSYIAAQTRAIVFGLGYIPRVADFACWISLLLTAQACISTTIRWNPSEATY